MKQPEWYYPRDIEEFREYIKLDGVVIYGGGTGLLRREIRKFAGFIDISKLPLKFVNIAGEQISIGGRASYNDVASEFMAQKPNSIMGKSLGKAASTPLRNLITVGGSLAMAPIWSDILGPLVALDAGIELIGENEGEFAVCEAIRERKIDSKTLVKQIDFTDDFQRSYYYRETRTRFDYPAFTISILANLLSDRTFEDVRIVIAGDKNRFSRLDSLEDKLIGQEIANLDLPSMIESLDLEFADKKHGSSNYLKHVAQIQLERGLKKIVEE